MWQLDLLILLGTQPVELQALLLQQTVYLVGLFASYALTPLNRSRVCVLHLGLPADRCFVSIWGTGHQNSSESW